MMQLAITVLAIFLLLVINEWWWRDRTHGEVSRKFIHITVGTFVAFWPLFLSWGQIELLSVAFVIAVLVSQRLNVFRAIHSVQRPTHGEVFFGASVGLVALATDSPAIYMVALLHMSLADGLAAIIGVKYGRNNGYHIFTERRSVVGTLTFFLVSGAILTGFALQQGTGFHIGFGLLAVGAALLENAAIRGLDNLLIPLFVAAMLGWVL